MTVDTHEETKNIIHNLQIAFFEKIKKHLQLFQIFNNFENQVFLKFYRKKDKNKKKRHFYDKNCFT